VDSQYVIYHIPSLLNGKIGNKSMKTVSKVVTYVNSASQSRFRQHKLTMIGDTFLSGIRENIEHSLSRKVCIYSMVKSDC